MNGRTSAFDEVKQKVDLVEFLSTHMGVEFYPDGPNRVSACCPFHGEDTPSFKVEMTPNGWKRWHCYGACQEGGTVIDAVKKKEHCDERAAVEYLDEVYELGIQLNSEAWKSDKKITEAAKAKIEQAQAEMSSGSKAAQQARAYLYKRGLTDDTIDYFGLAVDTSNTQAGRLAIPIRDKVNAPRTMSNRALFDEFPCANCKVPVRASDVVKQRFRAKKALQKGEAPIDWKACPHCQAPEKEARISWLVKQHPKYLNEANFEKSRILYNEFNARHALRDDDSIGYFLCEGYGDVWSAHQAEQRAVSSYNGAVLSEWQAAEAGKLALAADKPLILVPDFDKAGIPNVRENIKLIRQFVPEVEVQVVSSLGYYPSGDRIKDMGDLLKEKGQDALAKVLKDKRWQADEWLIHEVLDATAPGSDEPVYSKRKQLELIAEILSEVHHRTSLDHLAPTLSQRWNIGEDEARKFIYMNISSTESMSNAHVLKDIDQARIEAELFLKDKFVIKHGFEEIDECLPGGGARTRQLAMFLGKSGTGKTMLTTQILANMAQSGLRSIFFSLEQPADQLYFRMCCQVIGCNVPEAMKMVEDKDPRLMKLDEVFRKNLLIVDNVPKDTEVQAMTPSRVQKIIQEANMTYFEKPAQVIAIDHLGIVRVPDHAPRDVQNSDMLAAGYIMQELFSVTKMMNVYTMVLQQLPKEIKEGVEFPYDAGRGGSKQTDYCDYIYCIWRPEREEGLRPEDMISREGKYKLKLGKNRHGPSNIANLYFDKTTLRIQPQLQITPPISQDEVLEADIAKADARAAQSSDGSTQVTLESAPLPPMPVTETPKAEVKIETPPEEPIDQTQTNVSSGVLLETPLPVRADNERKDLTNRPPVPSTDDDDEAFNPNGFEDKSLDMLPEDDPDVDDMLADLTGDGE